MALGAPKCWLLLMCLIVVGKGSEERFVGLLVVKLDGYPMTGVDLVG